MTGSTLLTAMPILATLDEAGKKFSRWPDFSERGWTIAFLVAVLAALVVLGVYIVRKFLMLLGSPQMDLALFEDLADAHDLTRHERRSLLALARREKLDDPARLFTEPNWLESSSDPSLAPLRDRLFGA